MTTQTSPIETPDVVSHEEWVSRRTAFLAKEKEFTRLRDKLTKERSELPWEEVTKSYVFEGPSGKQTLAELFGDKSQLLIYHFMFDPAWDDGVQELLLRRRQLRWRDRAPRRAGYRVRGDLAGALRQDRELQAAHGMALPVAVVVRHRVQLRLRRHDRRDPHRVQLRAGHDAARRSAVQGGAGRAERVRAGWRPGVPHATRPISAASTSCSTPTTSSTSHRSAATRAAGSCRGSSTTTSTRAER